MVICFIDDGAADLACRHLGYDQATSRATNQFEVLSRNYTKYFHFLANNITCGEAKSLDECKVSFSRGECSEGDEVVVYCENRDDARKIVKMQLVAGNEIELRGADTGIAKVFIETAHSYTSGLVYYAGHRAMELACQFMGYKNVTYYDFNFDFKYASREGVLKAGYAIDSIFCSEDAKELEDCDVEFTEENHMERLGTEMVFGCGNGEDDDNYELRHLGLYTIRSEYNLNATNPGVLLITLSHREEAGFVYKANHHAMELACKQMGYSGLRTYEYNENFEFAYELFADLVGYLIDEVECPENAQDFNECNVRLSDPGKKKAPGHELVLHCGMNDEYELEGIHLVAGRGNELYKADMGIAKVYLKMAHSYTSGLVYTANYRALELACQFMGYKNVTYYDFNLDFKYASREGVLKAGYAIESVYCPDDAQELKHCDVQLAEGDLQERLGTEMVFECGNGEDDDNYELDHLGLYTIRSEFNLNTTNPGVLLITLSHREEAGFVYKANHHAMELACKQMGYPGLKTYEYNENFEFAYELFADLVGYLIDEVQCPEDVQDFNECKVRLSDPGKKKAPGHELVLHCGMNDEYELEGIHLVAGRGNELNKADMGIAKVYLKMAHSYTSGLVYTANNRAMELACQFMGYKNVTYYDFNFDFKYASREGVLKAGYAIESVYCSDDAKELKDCDVQLAEGDPQERAGTEMVFECGNGEDDDNYELEHFGLYTIRSESDVAITNPGVVFISLSHSKGAGFVYKANHHAMVLACKQMGYPGLKTYGHNEDFEFVTKQFTDLLGYLIDEVECPENAQDFNECKVRLSDPEEKKESGHELVLHCGMNDGEDDGIGAISYDFGGFKSTIKINKAKGKILIEDIIDYIFG